MLRSSPSDVLSAWEYMADLHGEGTQYITNKVYTRYSCNIFPNPETAAEVPPRRAAVGPLRWNRCGRAIARMARAALEKPRRTAAGPPGPASPGAAAQPATTGRAAPPGGNDGSAGCGR